MTRHLLLPIAAATLAASTCCIVPSVWALETPHSCGADPHIQCARFDEDQVYRVATMPGRAVLVQLEPGEAVMDKGAGIGDAKAWAMSTNDNWVLLKPRASQPDTNLMLVTNRRRYTLSLVSVSHGQPATWVLKFDYPDTQARNSAAAARRQAAVAIALGGGQSVTGGLSASNTAYFMRGNRELAPTAAWDDGRFTYFRYMTSRDLPKVFTILPDGSEATANFHMEGDTIVIHETAKQFVIRYGAAVLGIRNDGYSPDGRYNTTGSSRRGTARLQRDPNADSASPADGRGSSGSSGLSGSNDSKAGS
jgi:type IV secretion system protein VirB9